MRIQLKNVRLSFPKLWKPEAYGDNPTPVFEAAFLFAPGSEAHKALEAAMVAAAQERWGAKAQQTLKGLVAGGKVCLRNGDEKADLDGYAGNLFLNARSPKRPLVVDKDRAPLVEADGKPYAGCFVNAIVDVYAQDHAQYGKRINAALGGVQFIRDGEAFGAKGVAETDFDEVDEDMLA